MTIPKSEESLTLEYVLKNSFIEMMKDVHTMLPGVIDIYDSTTQRAKIKIAFSQESTEGEPINYPALLDIPVQMMRWGGFNITMPVSKGDECAVFFSERSLDRFKELGADDEPPQDARFFDITDGFAVPGLFSRGNALVNVETDAFQIRDDLNNVSITMHDGIGGKIEIKNGLLTFTIENGKIKIENASGDVIDLISQILGALESDSVIINSGSSAGTYPLTNAATYTAIKTLLDTFKI